MKMNKFSTHNLCKLCQCVKAWTTNIITVWFACNVPCNVPRNVPCNVPLWALKKKD